MTERSYYGQPVIKPPVWTWEIPIYFFAGGVTGVSSVVAALARRAGEEDLARVARRLAAAGAVVSPILLTSDLGRPARFHHMLRVLRPTSPMSVGSWILAGYSPAALWSWLTGRAGRTGGLFRLGEWVSALLGPALSTYTAVLIADTAVPIWHEARRELPFVFAGSALSGAGSILLVALPGDGSARAISLAGSTMELTASGLMERRLGELGRPYQEKRSGLIGRAAKICTLIGMGGAIAARKRAWVTTASAVVMAAGSLLERWAIFEAGFASAREPEHTVAPQRDRLRRSGR